MRPDRVVYYPAGTCHNAPSLGASCPTHPLPQKYCWAFEDRGVTARRFPQPWSAEDNGACFIVKDKNGQPIAYVYYEEEADRRSAAKLLTRDEARRIAANIAKLPHLLTRKSASLADQKILSPRGTGIRCRAFRWC